MSYILDALRRADAERERDPARGIHAQAGAGVPASAPAGVPPWVWAAGACAVLVAAGLLAWPRPAAQSAPPASAAVAMRPPVAAAVPAAPVLLPPPPLVPVVKAAPAPVAPAPAVRASEPAKPAPAAERVYQVAELPGDVQGQLPKLAISGGVHSDNAAQRMLIVGGQVVNEGAEVAPGVVLEQIRQRTAVLRFRGYRYSVGY